MDLYYYLCRYLKKKSKLLRNISLKNRLVIFIPLGMTLCILIMGSLMYMRAKLALKSKSEIYSKQILNIFSQDIERNRQFYERALSEFAIDDEVINGVINYKFMSYQERAEFSEFMDNLTRSKLSLLPDLVEVEVVSKDYKIIYMQGFKYFSIDEIEKYSKIADNGTIWFYSKLNDGEKRVCLARPLKNNGVVEGYIFLAIKKEAFASSFYLLDTGIDSDILLIDDNDNIIISKNNMIIDKNINDYKQLKNFVKNKKNSDSKSMIKIDSENYLVNYQKQKNFNWYIVMFTPHKYIHSDISDIRIEIITIAIIFILLVGVMSCLLYFSVKEPLYRLLNSMNKVSNGDLAIQINDEYNDEIGLLREDFNYMMGKISELIKQIKLQEVEKRDLEIRMLQAQINPHFLFNTLNSLKWTAIISQNYVISDGLNALAELLRSTIIDKNELINIEDELKNIKNYIVIQKIRYGDSFHIEYLIDNTLLKKKIIKFILQPIIENCIIHGFDTNKEAQKIILSIQKVHVNIEIIIEDNGKGFDLEEVFKDNKLSGIGWNNVDERIKLIFGDNYGCKIKSILNKGTIVNIIIPNRD